MISLRVKGQMLLPTFDQQDTGPRIIRGDLSAIRQLTGSPAMAMDTSQVACSATIPKLHPVPMVT